MKIAKALAYSALISLLVVVSLVVVIASAQTSSAPQRISQSIDESQRTILRGNTYPLARPEFDRGLAPASLPMEHLLLVLKRSPEQESALDTLMAEQQEKSSPNYHQWLTPAEFGLRFGPGAQDIQTVVQWLTSHRLGVSQVTPGRTVIEFSGTAAQVQQAFHTEIHMYEVNGEQHWANASDPEIPTALTPLVVGVNALHNFKRIPASRRFGTFSRSNATREVRSIKPEFTYPSGCTPTGANANCNFALGPADFGAIYNVATLWNAGITGTGQKIAVLGQASVNPSDIAAFRSMFGLQPNAPTIIDVPTDPPPALGAAGSFGDEGESDLDLEWTGAIAPDASIIFVTAGPPQGVDASAVYAVNNNVAPIIGFSYGLCEFALETTGNANFNALWQQAAAEGITVAVSTGDNDAAGCDTPTAPTPMVPNVPAQPATMGLAVSGLASTPYNVAVGGTDFNDLTNPTTYWNTTNSGATQLSAKGYIPETTYNDSCANAVLGLFSGFSTIPIANCNNLTSQTFIDLIAPFGGNGGMSNCTTPTGTSSVTQCSGGYAKPAWQVGPGVPNDGKRDVPDLSLFAGDGFAGSFYIVCQSDTNTGNAACNLNSPFADFSGFGGTSASAQAFAGIMALVNQKNSPTKGQGLVNSILYELADQQSGLSCNSSSPASTCVFNDVTVGTISAPCQVGSPNCSVTSSGEANGILSGCDASAGYDLATGLGSFNAANLVNGWSTVAASTAADFQLSLQNCNATANVTSPGSSGSIGVTITPVNSFTGAYTISCSGLPSLATCSSTQTANGAVTNVTVTVATNAGTALVPTGWPAWRGWWPARIVSLLISVAFLVFVMKRLRSGPRRWAVGLAGTAVLFLLAGGCGGSSTSTPPPPPTGGTPTGFVSGATLTVTSGSTTHTMPFNVNVE